MSSAEPKLFGQIVSATHQILRLRLQLARGNPSVAPKIEELEQAITVKQALLDGLTSREGDSPVP